MAIGSPTKASRNTRELISLAVHGLVFMFDPEKQLFCHLVRWNGEGFVRKGVSRRYTMMALLGLHALQKTGGECPFDVGAVFASCVGDSRWIQSIGDLGLLIWLTAECAPDKLDELFQKVDLETSFDRFADARECRTMELAWFLTGLSYAAGAAPSGSWPLEDLAVDTYRRLRDNQRETGLFGHLETRASLSGRLRGRYGTFADQIYPINALSRFGTAFHVEEPLEMAVECASTICRLQGSQGQWWWVYDAETARVVCRYPVFSVDQYGLAPLALFELERATGQNFQDSVWRGLDWIYGANELGEDLRTSSRQLIWTCILPKSNLRRYLGMVRSFVRPERDPSINESLHVLHESRPYELGLLLCSIAKGGLAGS